LGLPAYLIILFLILFAVPVLLVGDVNIRLDRPTDADTVQFTELLAAHGLINHVTSPTHDLGGMLMSSLRESTCRRCSLTCMTSVCQITDCYNGQRS